MIIRIIWGIVVLDSLTMSERVLLNPKMTLPLSLKNICLRWLTPRYHHSILFYFANKSLFPSPDTVACTGRYLHGDLLYCTLNPLDPMQVSFFCLGPLPPKPKALGRRGKEGNIGFVKETILF